MSNYCSIIAYNEPQDIYEFISGKEEWVEMSSVQHGFLCGLIKEKRSQKILEIGTSAGGTTAIILNCCNKLKLNAEVYTVDLLECCWHDDKRETGFVVEECKEFLTKGGNHFKYRKFTGSVYPDFCDEIGVGIDLLLLDTAHSLPGEILDFIACIPYLNEDAIVVLHDVTLNHSSGAIYNYATKLLFDVVSAEKYMMFDDNNSDEKVLSPEDVANIAAFRMNAKIKEDILDLFSLLSITWNYDPGYQTLMKYRKQFVKHYSEECIKLYDFYMRLQKDTSDARKVVDHAGLFLINEWRRLKNVYLYGAGYWGKKYFEYARNYSLPLKGMIISDDRKYDDSWGKSDIKLLHLSDVEDRKDITIIIALDIWKKSEIAAHLSQKGFENVI